VAERSAALRSAVVSRDERRRALRTLARAAVIAACAGLTSAAAPAEQHGSVFVVRHAEKLDPNDSDSPLSRAGEARALVLAERLQARGIRSIFVSEKRRTRATAAPLAKRLGLEPHEIASATHVEDPRAMVRAIGEQRARGAVLVVTHSDAIPGLICELTGKAVPEVDDDEYDRIYEVAGSELSAATYGAPFSRTRELRSSACERLAS